MAISFASSFPDKLKNKILNFLQLPTRYSKTFSELIDRIGREKNIQVVLMPEKSLVDQADWNAKTQTVRLEDNPQICFNFIYQLCKAINPHYRYIKFPNEFFTASEYAKYIEELNYLSYTTFRQILLELKNARTNLPIHFNELDIFFEKFNAENKNEYLKIMQDKDWWSMDFSHMDIFCAQWEKFIILDKISKVVNLLNELLDSDLNLENKMLPKPTMEVVLDMMAVLFDLTNQIECYHFLSTYPVPQTFKAELLTEADSLQPAMQVQKTYMQMHDLLNRLNFMFPFETISSAQKSLLKELTEVVANRIELNRVAERESADYLTRSSEQYSRCITHYESLKRGSLRSKFSPIHVQDFQFDAPNFLPIIEGEYRQEFIETLDRGDDVLREFQIAYFDDLLNQYRENCKKAIQGNKDFLTDSQGDVVDKSLIDSQIIPKEPLTSKKSFLI